MPGFWYLAAAVVGSAISGASSASNQKKQRQSEIKNRTDAVNAAEKSRQASLASARKGDFEGKFGFDDIFGTKINPVFPESVSKGVSDNVSQFLNQGVPTAIQGINTINQNLGETQLAFNLDRIENLVPTFRDSVNQIGETSNDLINGRLPKDVAENVIGNTSGLAASLGTPGGSFPTALKDLGLTTLDAFDRGQNSLQSLFNSLAANVSPIPRFQSATEVLPFTSLTADQRVGRELQTTEAKQRAEIIAAMADPAASQLFFDEFQTGQRNAAILAGTNVPNFAGGVAGQAVGAGVTAAGAEFQRREDQKAADARNDKLIKEINNNNTGASAG